MASCTSTRPVEEVLVTPNLAGPGAEVSGPAVAVTGPEAEITHPVTGSSGQASSAAAAPRTGEDSAKTRESAASPGDASATGPPDLDSRPTSAPSASLSGELTPADQAALAPLARLRLQQSRVECSALLTKARAADASYETLMAAARALVLNADLRLQSTLALNSTPAALPPPEVLIDLEDEVSSELKSQIRSLASSSAKFAQRALRLRPEDPAAELFSTLGTGLRLWSMPTLQALASGAATTLPGQIKRLAATSPDFEGASPLRLKGRFQSRAPWPFKDLEQGRDTLAAAVDVAPIPLNLLFLGDAHWLCGEKEAALERWREATIAEADAETEVASPFIREIARLRIESAKLEAER